MVSALMLLASCGSKTPLTGDQKAYAGNWTSTEGDWLKIKESGSADLKKGGTKVTNGSVTITETMLTVTMLGIDTEYTVDEAPYEEEGEWYMELDGDLYYK